MSADKERDYERLDTRTTWMQLTADYRAEKEAEIKDLRTRLAECERERDEWAIKAEVLDGTSCNEEQANGDGPCGVCVNCLRAERDRLRACHEAELGVCYQHCDEVNDLQSRLDRLIEGVERVLEASLCWDATEYIRDLIREARGE